MSCQAEGQASSEWSGAAEALDGETGYLTYSTYVDFTYHRGTILDGGLGVKNEETVYRENSPYNIQKFRVFGRTSERIQVEGYPRLAARRSNIISPRNSGTTNQGEPRNVSLRKRGLEIPYMVAVVEATNSRQV